MGLPNLFGKDKDKGKGKGKGKDKDKLVGRGCSTTSFEFYGSFRFPHSADGWRGYLEQRRNGCADNNAFIDRKASIKNQEYNRGLNIGLTVILDGLKKTKNNENLIKTINRTISYINFMIGVTDSDGYKYDESYCENRYRMIEESSKAIYYDRAHNSRSAASPHKVSFEGFEDVCEGIAEHDRLKIIELIDEMFIDDGVGSFIREHHLRADIEKLLDLYTVLHEYANSKEQKAGEVFRIINASLGVGESETESTVSTTSTAITVIDPEEIGGSDLGDSLESVKEVVGNIAKLRLEIRKLGEDIAKIKSGNALDKDAQINRLQVRVAVKKALVDKKTTTLRDNALFVSGNITANNLVSLISGGQSKYRVDAVVDAVVNNNKIHTLVIDDRLNDVNAVSSLLKALRLNKHAGDVFTKLEIKKGFVDEVRLYIEQCALGFTKIITPFVSMQQDFGAAIRRYVRSSTELMEFNGLKDNSINNFIKDCILRNRILEIVNSKYGLKLVGSDYEIPDSVNKTTMFVFEKEGESLGFKVVYSDANKETIEGVIDDKSICVNYYSVIENVNVNENNIYDIDESVANNLGQKIRSALFSKEDYSDLFGDSKPNVLDFNLPGYGGAKTVERIIKVLSDNYQGLGGLEELAFYHGPGVSDYPVELSKESLDHLVSVLISASNMERFSMSGYKISNFLCPKLDAKKVYGKQPYRKLDLSNAGLGDDNGVGFNLLVNGFDLANKDGFGRENRCKLESLNLAGNDLLVPALYQLPLLLRFNASTLKELDLSYNDLSDENAFENIMKVCFEKCNSLQKLNLRGCKLSDKSMEIIWKYAENRNKDIKVNLYVDCNERIAIASKNTVTKLGESQVEVFYSNTDLATSEARNVHEITPATSLSNKIK